MTHQRTGIIPPLWLLLALLAQLGLHLSFPVLQLWLRPQALVGLLPLIAGFALAGWGAWTFKRAGTPVRPFAEISALVTAGPFRFSRNPMYLGMLLVLTGVAMLLGSATPLLVIPFFFGLIRDLFVIPEEALMHEVFGDEYVTYCARVRRWL